MLLKPTNHTPLYTGSARSFHGDTEKGIKVCGTGRFCSEHAHKYTDVRPKTALAHTAQVEHHKEDALDYI